MGKRRLGRIELIQNANTRKVTFCKRKKGLLKKSIELSILCNLETHILISDPKDGRCIHFSSNPKKNLLSYFNEKCHREFFTNSDYLKMGGRREDLPPDLLAI